MNEVGCEKKGPMRKKKIKVSAIWDWKAAIKMENSTRYLYKAEQQCFNKNKN